jgi:hypothetical protein
MGTFSAKCGIRMRVWDINDDAIASISRLPARDWTIPVSHDYIVESATGIDFCTSYTISCHDGVWIMETVSRRCHSACVASLAIAIGTIIRTINFSSKNQSNESVSPWTICVFFEYSIDNILYSGICVSHSRKLAVGNFSKFYTQITFINDWMHNQCYIAKVN